MRPSPQLETGLWARVYTLTIKFAPNLYYPTRGHLQLTKLQLRPGQDLAALSPGPTLQAADSNPSARMILDPRPACLDSQLSTVSS